MWSRVLRIALVCALLPVTSASGKKVDKIIAKHIKARGGIEKLQSVDTAKTTGTIVVQGFEAPFTEHRKRPDLLQVEADFQGMKVVQAFDGETAWWIMPFMGIVEPEAMPENQVKLIRAEAAFDGILPVYKEEGYTVELEGKEEVEGTEAFKLKVTLAEGNERTIYLDAETYLEIKHVYMADLQGTGTESEVETYFNDYRDVDGLMVPHKITNKSGGAVAMEIDVGSIDFGVDVADRIFMLPLAAEEIVAKHVEARGGAEKLKSVSTMKATGRVLVQGMELPATQQRQRPNQYRLDVDLQGQAVIQSYDGKKAWWVFPPLGIFEAAEMPELQAKPFIAGADFDGLLVDHKAKGHKVELVGIETLQELDGMEVYHLKVTLKSGDERHAYLDTGEFLERKSSGQGQDLQGMEAVIENVFRDYKEVGGVPVAHSVEFLAEGMPMYEAKIDTVDFGVTIDPEIFMVPPQVADAALALEQIVAKNLEARGGTAGMGAVNSLKATGTVMAQGFELPIELHFKRPNSFHLKVDLQGMEMIQAFDGKVAWRVSPMEGVMEPEPIPDEAKGAVLAFSEFVWGTLSDQEGKGPKAELIGVDKVARDEVYHLKVTTSSGDVRNVFLGGQDFLEHKVSFKSIVQGAETDVEALLGDFKPVGGMVLPHLIENRAGGMTQFEMLIDNVEVNAEIDDAIFALPKKEETGS